MKLSTRIVLLLIVVFTVVILSDWYYGLAWRTTASSWRDDECRNRLDKIADLLNTKNNQGEMKKSVPVSFENLGSIATCPNGCPYGTISILRGEECVSAIVCACNHHEHRRGWNLKYDRVMFVKVIDEKRIREILCGD